MLKFKNKYRIKSTRLPHWDYGSNGYYFVTVCTKNRLHWFGEVTVRRDTKSRVCGDITSRARRDTKSCVSTKNVPYVALSYIGEIAQKCWEAIPDHFPFVKLDSFVLMPNHVHGIIVIDKPSLETQDLASLQKNNQFGPQSKNLASIIRGYKSGVTKLVRKISPDFSWQARFYDHIIRNETTLNSIRNYIKFNAEKWEYDRENENNIPITIKRKFWKTWRRPFEYENSF